MTALALIDTPEQVSEQIRRKLAVSFLRLLDADRTRWEFRTFDDTKNNPALTKKYSGDLADNWNELAALNAKGAGIFVVINPTDGMGQKAENVTGVAALFADTDGAPLEPLLKLKPHIVVQSSQGKWHVYWRVEGCPKEQFKPFQAAIAKQYGTDSAVCDLPRVMRLPGFFHNKATPFLTSLDADKCNAMQPPYSGQEIIDGLVLQIDCADKQPAKTSPVSMAILHDAHPETVENIARVKAMLEAIPADCGRDEWRQIVWAILSTGWTCAEEIARNWSLSVPDKFSETDFSNLVRDYKPTGGIGFGTLVHHARQHGWVEQDTVEHFTGYGADVANGKLYAEMHRGKLLFVHETNEVLRFDETRGYLAASPNEEDRAAKVVLAKLREKAADAFKQAADDPKTKRLIAHAERTSKLPSLRAMIEMAKSEPGMTVSIKEFDADPFLLGVANGVLDLRSQKLLPVSPELLVSKRCNVAYDLGAAYPLFQRFLSEVQPDPDMQAFLQRWTGYCLTGSAVEQKFTFLHGGGANGKSVFVELLAWLLGDYARKVATEMLMQHQRSPQGPSPDIVALKGARMVYANETEEGRRLAEARVKDMTGGDTLTGRVPYGKADIIFSPTHKLVVVGNHRPEITDQSMGMWRRVALVPFDVTIPDAQRDARLLEKLKAEGPGILNWALEGLRQWQSGGLALPRKIEAATAAYRDEQDIIGEWLNAHCNTGAGHAAKKDAVYCAYRNWALHNGHNPLAQGRLTRRLSERGYKPLPDKRTLGGLSLNDEGVKWGGR